MLSCIRIQSTIKPIKIKQYSIDEAIVKYQAIFLSVFNNKKPPIGEITLVTKNTGNTNWIPRYIWNVVMKVSPAKNPCPKTKVNIVIIVRGLTIFNINAIIDNKNSATPPRIYKIPITTIFTGLPNFITLNFSIRESSCVTRVQLGSNLFTKLSFSHW